MILHGAALLPRKASPSGVQNFMVADKVQLNATADKADANASSAASVTPSLQHSEVYDADFPVDMAAKTPMELRYQAQADYAKAITSLKKEAAEAEAARKEMEKQLAELQAAERAAAEAAAAAASANGAQGAISKEQADLIAAKKAYADA